VLVRQLVAVNQAIEPCGLAWLGSGVEGVLVCLVVPVGGGRTVHMHADGSGVGSGCQDGVGSR
jgi:hypothetical protein